MIDNLCLLGYPLLKYGKKWYNISIKETRKILLFDIETAPSLGYSWNKWQTDIIEFTQNWYILSFSAKWLGGKQLTKGLIDYPHYRKDKENDRAICRELWELFDEADILIAHNGDEFDIKKCNVRFAFHNFKPPRPYKSIDTKKIAKANFNFGSNKLDDLGSYLGIGRKLKHQGFEMWKGCIAGNKKDWASMKRYNAQDVLLLEKIYLHLRPWGKGPNMSMYSEGTSCPKCGSNKGFIRGGLYMNSTTKYQCWRCRQCRGQSRSIVNLREFKPGMVGI